MPWLILITFLLMIAYGLLLQFYQDAWRSIPVFTAGREEPSTTVSVVIALRNESRNIPTLLACLLAQQYPEGLLEIVFVDDHSEDDTAAQLQKALTYAPFRMKLIRMQEQAFVAHKAFKKKAIETGIRQSTGQLIITTDADCRFGTQWLRHLVRYQEQQGAQFIAAPVKMSGKQSLLSIFQSVDFMALQGITGAAVQRKFHAMCNGANLLYTRSAFEMVNGFEGIDNIPSGDDMLLMHKICKRFPDQVFFLKDPEVIVTTSTEQSWKAFFQQRIRWASKAVHYEDKHIFGVLLGIYLLNACFLLLFCSLFWHPLGGFFFFLFLLAKVLIEYPFMRSVAGFFGQEKLLAWFIVLQPLHIVYTLLAGWLGRFGSYSWKGRVIQNFKVR
ncbi:MAG: hypothetical protein RL732_295 [Bacteroidota bacterium]|jgi:cellulose synthase/poly-beta-1,6-N-acetylglucosamine synthase-like glycosyltransferase